MKNEPMGLPKGTVRGLAFLMIVATMCWGAITGPVEVKDFIPLVTLAMGYYFGQRGAEKKNEYR
jgi:hypothetical protein